METLGQQIRRLRKALRFTQADLAQDFVTASMISQIESDRVIPSAKLLAHIVTRLGVSMDDLSIEALQKTDIVNTHREARNLIEAGNYPAAIEILVQIVTSKSSFIRMSTVFSDLATCYERLDNIEAAIPCYESMVGAAFERDDIATAVHAYYHLGHAHRRTKQSELALMYWQRGSDVLSRHPDLQMPIALKIHANLGRIYYESHQIKRALSCYQVAEQLAVQFADSFDLALIYHGLTNVYGALGQFEKALAANKQATTLYEQLQHQRNIHLCMLNQSLILKKQGKWQELIQYTSDCLQKRELQADTQRRDALLVDRACGYHALGDHARALTDVQVALMGQTGNGELHWIQAHCLLAQGHPLEAIERLEACLPKLSDTPKIIMMEWKVRLLTLLQQLKADMDDDQGALGLTNVIVTTMLEGLHAPRIG